MENIVRMEELASVVEETLLKINDGVAAARKRGVLADVPKEVTFSITVISSFQALELQGATVVESTNEQGDVRREVSGGDEKEKRETKQTGKNIRTSEETTGQENAHNRESTDTYEYE